MMASTDRPQSAQPAVSPERALRPAPSRTLATRRPLLPALAARAVPALTRSAGVVAVSLAAEYALRTLANRSLAALGAPARRSTPTATRTVITEYIVVEWARRRR